MDSVSSKTPYLERLSGEIDINTTIFQMIVVVAIGIYLLLQTMKYRKMLVDYNDQQSKSTDQQSKSTTVQKSLNYTMMAISAIMILWPLWVLVTNYTGLSGKVRSMDKVGAVLKSQTIIMVLSVILFVLVIVFKIQMNKIGLVVDDTLTISVVTLFTTSALFLGLRYYTDYSEQKRLTTKYSYKSRNIQVDDSDLPEDTKSLTYDVDGSIYF